MADTPYPLPRETRESTILVGNGTAGPYGPSQYSVFDIDDVTVWTKAAGETFFTDVTAGCTVAKTSGEEYDTFSITFWEAVPATTEWYHSAKRVAERSLAVTRAGSINSPQLEKELSKKATVLSELRRDIGRTLQVQPGQPVPFVEPLPDGHISKWKDGHLIDGGSAADIENAQENAAATKADRDAVAQDKEAVENLAQMAANVPQHSFASKTEAALFDPTVDPSFIWIDGDYYHKVAAEPAHDGKVQTASGAWYEVDTRWPVLPQMFGVQMNASTSQATAFQAILDAGVTDILIPRGKTIRLDTTVTATADVYIHGGGTLDFTNGNAQFIVAGSLTQIDDLSADVVKHTQTLQWAADQGLAARDIVLGYNPTDYSWGSRRPGYRDGFMFRIHSMSGNSARTYGLAVDAYAAANFDIYKMTAPRVRIQDITVIAGAASSLSALQLTNCQDVIISGVRGWGGVGGILEVNQCFGVDIDGSVPMNNSPVMNDEYGIIIANSHNVNVRGGNPMATRHCVTVGGYDGVGAIPNRFINISGVTLLNQSLGTAAASADTHGNSDFVSYDNCTMMGGPSGGRNISIRNSTIFSVVGSAAGECIYGAEVVGGFFNVENCTLISEGDGAATKFIHLIPMGPGNGTNRPVETNMRDDFHLFVRNCTLITPNAGPTAVAVGLRCHNTNKKVSVTVDGLKWLAPQGLAFVYADDDEQAALPSDGLIVDNVSGPSGAYLIYPTSDVPAVPTREMAQRGTTDVVLSAASLVYAATQTPFRYPYSRLPVTSVDVTLPTGAAMTTAGGKVPIPRTFFVSPTGIQPCVQSADGANFTAGATLRLPWTAGVFNL